MALSPGILALGLLLQPLQQGVDGSPATYGGVGRRDPFATLLSSRPAEPPCSEFLGCVAIDSVELRGTIRTARGAAAIVTVGSRSFLLRAGDTLRDGRVTEVGEIHVAFRQVVNDPLAVKPFRDVVKSLRLLSVRGR